MPVGLLAKLVTLLLFVLAAVGVFVGGEKFVSLLDRARGPAPPAAVRSAPDSVPHTALEPPPTVTAPRRPAPGVATLTPYDRPPSARTPDPMPRPTRGALRPTTEPQRPRAEPPPPPPERRAEAPPPRPAPEPVPIAPRAPVDTTPAPEPEPAPLERAPGVSTPPIVTGDAEPVLVDLRIGRLVSRTVVAYRQGEEALVPLGTFFDMAEIQATVSAEGRLDARLEPSGRSVRVAAGGDSLFIGGRTLPVTAAQLLFRDGELYLATERLGTMLDLDFDISWPDLTVAVLNPDSLPVARRLRRDQMRMLLAERNGVHPDTTLGPMRTKWDGLVLDYDLAFPLSDNLVGGSNYQFALGAQVAGGALELGVRSLGPLESGEAEFAASWKGVWIDNKYVKQVTLGTGTLTGPRYAGIRGVAVTNSPYIRPTYVGQLDYYGRLEPGWELEAYAGSQLVAFDSIGPSGDYSLTLPVGYGENPVDFVAYGPYRPGTAFQPDLPGGQRATPLPTVRVRPRRRGVHLDALHRRVERRPALRPLPPRHAARRRGRLCPRQPLRPAPSLRARDRADRQ